MVTKNTSKQSKQINDGQIMLPFDNLDANIDASVDDDLNLDAAKVNSTSDADVATDHIADDDDGGGRPLHSLLSEQELNELAAMEEKSSKLPKRPGKYTVWLSPRKKVRLIGRKNSIKPTKNLYCLMLRKMRYLLNYTYQQLEKFPKGVRMYAGVGSSIARASDECMKGIHAICAYNPKLDKEMLLRDLSVELKTLEDLVDIASNRRYITRRNRDAWLGMLNEIDNLAIGIAMWLEREARKGAGDAPIAGKI